MTSDNITSRELPKIRKAAERIAKALERQVDADPLAMLNEVMLSDDGPVAGDPGAVIEELQMPFANNGQTIMYRHPDPAWEIVLRKDATADSGYRVNVERA